MEKAFVDAKGDARNSFPLRNKKGKHIGYLNLETGEVSTRNGNLSQQYRTNRKGEFFANKAHAERAVAAMAFADALGEIDG